VDVVVDHVPKSVSHSALVLPGMTFASPPESRIVQSPVGSVTGFAGGGFCINPKAQLKFLFAQSISLKEVELPFPS
jgi:hypothetical protein